MPNRILREGILTSERVNSLNWQAEVFYRRLMSVVDDFGRYYAHASLLRAALYPLKLDTVRDADIERLLTTVEQARLIRMYEVDGKRYLVLLDFRQQARAKDSKFPQPLEDDSQMRSTCTSDDDHVDSSSTSDAPVFGDGVVCGDEGGDVVLPRKSAAKAKRNTRLPENFELSEASIAHARERGIDIDTELEAFRNFHTAKGNVMADWQAAWRTWCGNAVKFGKANARASPQPVNKQEALEQRNAEVGRRWLEKQGIET